MSKAPSIPSIFSVADLLAIAYRIELDAVERYGLLADQMETHNNPELTKVFRDLSKAESIHAAEIREMAGDTDLNARPSALHSIWPKGESPEEVDLGAAHYLMTPCGSCTVNLISEDDLRHDGSGAKLEVACFLVIDGGACNITW
jgi:hypothetical protein